MADDESAPAKTKKKWALLSAPEEPSAPPSWLPLPHIVALMFIVFVVFVLMGVVVTALVLGGTITVSVKGIGLTQSLVLFSGIFTLVYVGVHVFAARRPDYDAGRQPFGRSPLHTRAVVLARITAALWAVALIAVGITLSELRASDPSQASAVGAIRCDLAASLCNCIGMIIICLVVERTKFPFRVHWITAAAPDPEAANAAKALIKDILGDGAGGSGSRHARVESVNSEDEEDEDEDEEATVTGPSTPPPPGRRDKKPEKDKDCEKAVSDAAMASSATLVGTPVYAFPSPQPYQTYMPMASMPSMASLHPAMHPAALYPGVNMMHPGTPLASMPPILQPPATAAARASSPYGMGYFPYQMPQYPYMSPQMPEPAVAPASPAPAAPKPVPAASPAPPPSPPPKPPSPAPPQPKTPVYTRIATPPVPLQAPPSMARRPVFTRPENSVPPRVNGGPRPFPRPTDDRTSPGNGRYKPYTPSWSNGGGGKGYRRPGDIGGSRSPGNRESNGSNTGGNRTSNGSSVGGPRSPGGKQLFNQAAAGLRYSSGSYASPSGLSAPFEPRDPARGAHIPGAFE